MVLTPRRFEEWYKPFAREEKIWLATAIAVALIMAIVTIYWHLSGAKSEVPSTAIELSPRDALSRARDFASRYEGKLVPPDQEVYLTGIRFTWIPSEIVLKKGVVYKFIISSADVQHGLSIIGPDGSVINLMVMPGMGYIANIVFEKPGVYEIRCNEYCGVGHHGMIGRIIVVEG